MVVFGLVLAGVSVVCAATLYFSGAKRRTHATQATTNILECILKVQRWTVRTGTVRRQKGFEMFLNASQALL